MLRSLPFLLLALSFPAAIATGCGDAPSSDSSSTEEHQHSGDDDPDRETDDDSSDPVENGDADDPSPGDDPSPPDQEECHWLFPPELDPADFEVIAATPENYRSLKNNLQPGQWLALAPGTYDILRVNDIHGSPDAPIVISGPAPEEGEAVFLRRATNTIQIQNSSHVVLRNLRLDGTTADVGDAIQARQTSHHITLENLIIHDYAPRIGINTSNSAPTWNWTIRNVEIRNASTGMYLGSHGGDHPFVGGLIENNIIAHTTGYGIQIKEQNGRDYPGMPQDPQTTIIRNNRFISAGIESARPNLLVGHFPIDGPGSQDQYLIHHNLFFENEHSSENLFQGEGNVALYNNLFVNRSGGGGLNIRPHNHIPRSIHVLYNTFLTAGTAIRITGPDEDYPQVVAGNAIFSNSPLSLATSVQEEQNFTADFDDASTFVTDPEGDEEAHNLRPISAQLAKSPLESEFDFPGLSLDFGCVPREAPTYGAYQAQ